MVRNLEFQSLALLTMHTLREGILQCMGMLYIMIVFPGNQVQVLDAGLSRETWYPLW